MVNEAEKPPSLGEKVKETLKGAFEPIIDLFLWPVEKGIAWGLETLLDLMGERMAPILSSLVKGLEETEQVPPELQPILDEIKKPTGEIGILLAGGLGGAAVGGIASSILTPLLQPLSYMANKLRPVMTPDPSGLIVARYRGMVTASEYEIYMAQHGFDATWAGHLRDMARPLLSPDQIARLHLRGELLKGSDIEWLTKLGYDADNIANLRRLYQIIPGPTDLVRFELREVWRPEFRPELLKPAPSGRFIELMAKHGLSKDFANDYWAAHWELPSVGQAFEMFHRLEDFTEADVRTLMRRLDILPAYHDDLIAIAYRPYTRVDVRRMNAAGVLDERGVKDAYLALGYDDDKAGKMTDFTLAWNQAANRELTRSDITDGFKRTLLERWEAEEDLAALGYDTDEIAFYLDREDLKKAEALKSQYSTRYKKLYVKNLIDEAGLRAELPPLGFTVGEITTLIGLWDIEKRSQKETTSEEKERDLTRANVTDGYRKGILSPEETDILLAALGYDEDEIAFYKEREDYRKEADRVNDLLGAYQRQYLKGVIDEPALETALTNVPVPPEVISHSLRLWGLEKATKEWVPVTKEDFPGEEERVKDYLVIYKSRYLQGMITELELETALTAIPLTTDKVDYYVRVWGLEKSTRDWSPIAVPERDLTKADILDGYRKRIISPKETDEMLAGLGFSPSEVIFLKEKADYASEKDKRDLSLSTYRQLYTTGILDKTSTTAALADLDFAEEEIALLYELWDVEREGGARAPTRAELTRFLKKGIINDATWRTQLAMMGYSDRYIGWYQEDMRE